MLKQISFEFDFFFFFLFFAFTDKIKSIWSGERQKYCEERCQTQIQQKD